MTIAGRIEGLDWPGMEDQLDGRGWATTGPLLSGAERTELIQYYDDERRFRSHVVMQRHGFGRGEYRYFSYPLPPLVSELRSRIYGKLVPLANRWIGAAGSPTPFPDRLEDYLQRCHAAGQQQPTPLILRYGPGDYNCLHQDLYGAHSFPLQAAILLNQPAKDFTGGELVVTEQRPRMQSKVQVVDVEAGEAVIFAVNRRPVQGSRRIYHVAMRHGVSPMRSGRRHTLGIIFHDAA